jgi:tetratricopeptide (TPR) repeat protein
LDPLSLIINAVVGDTYLKARLYDQAIEQLKKTIEMDKNFVSAHRYLANAFIEKGMYKEAIAELQKATTLATGNSALADQRATNLNEAFASGGPQGFWNRQLQFLREDAEKGSVSPYSIASLYARLGDKEQALVWLEKAYHDHDAYVVYLKIDPQFDNFRSDPRIVGLMQRIGLP